MAPHRVSLRPSGAAARLAAQRTHCGPGLLGGGGDGAAPATPGLRSPMDSEQYGRGLTFLQRLTYICRKETLVLPKMKIQVAPLIFYTQTIKLYPTEAGF